MIISIGSDHAGFELRKQIMEHLAKAGHTFIEHGAVSSTVAASYIEAGQGVSQDLQQGRAERGIVICGTGLGISIVCNKHKGIRCAVCTDEFMARMSRQHNNANVLALGARVVGRGLALSIVDRFMEEPFETGGRHQVRVNDIAALEEKNFKAI